MISTSTSPRATLACAATNILSACSIRARRSSSRADVRGTARSAAPGRFTARVTAHRKRSSPGVNFKALEVAREIGVTVAINLIADPSWDERRFEVIRQWAMEIPEIVHLTVATPYPGTELWFTESRKLTTLDYRLYD